jgi:hypothetical protein
MEIGSEWGELAEEENGKPGRRLLWAARLLRDPERYVARFGRANYEVMLGDCLWHGRWSESFTAARTRSRARRECDPPTCLAERASARVGARLGKRPFAWDDDGGHPW